MSVICNIYVIMKTMCPPGYHHNGFVATHALGHMMVIFQLKQTWQLTKTISEIKLDTEQTMKLE